MCALLLWVLSLLYIAGIIELLSLRYVANVLFPPQMDWLTLSE